MPVAATARTGHAMTAQTSTDRALLFLLLCVAPLFFGLVAQAKEDGWTCESDGFYYENGVKSDYTCGEGSKDADGKSSGEKSYETCTNSENPGMPATYPRTCINGPPDSGPRCWWTYVPDSVLKMDTSLSQVPLVIDMHGGGGCASHQAASSGFKELSDTLGTDAFITVWPQGHDAQWGSCGSDCAEVAEETEGGKEMHSVDDVSFLSSMVATIVKSQAESNPSKGRVDAERVYATGFSMGCMMSHRLALEKSNIVAGFGCHGGTLIQPANPDLAEQKTRFDLQPMPAYMTGGSDDAWFELARPSFEAWAAWNSCSSATVTTDVDLTAGTPPTAELSIRSSCSASSTALEVVRLEIADGTHVPDERMATYTWDYLKNPNYRRAGALAALPAEHPAVDPPAPITTSKTSGAVTCLTPVHHFVTAFVATIAASFVSYGE